MKILSILCAIAIALNVSFTPARFDGYTALDIAVFETDDGNLWGVYVDDDAQLDENTKYLLVFHGEEVIALGEIPSAIYAE